MKKENAIERVNPRIKYQLNSKNTHVANINSTDPVWWVEIPISKCKTGFNILLCDKQDCIILLQIPPNRLCQNDFSTRVKKNCSEYCLSLEIVSNKKDRENYMKDRRGHSQVNFSEYIIGQYPL